MTGSLRARIEAADAAVIGDMHCAIESITEALEREYSPVEEEEAEEEEVEAEAEEEIKEEIKKLPVSILPIYIKVQLMMDRCVLNICKKSFSVFFL